MIALLSPSKTQDFETDYSAVKSTQLRFKDQSLELIELLKQYSPDEISKLMKLSQNLSELNTDRYSSYQKDFRQAETQQALMAFIGDVYTYIEVHQYDQKDFEFAQDHVRIISGLYGLVRPLDRIQTYRLEMKTALKNDKGKNLYAFWGSELREILEKDLSQQGDQVIVNLASMEYSKALQLSQIHAEVVTPVFKEKKSGKELSIIALYAKEARGMMTNFIIKNRLQKPEQLKAFDQTGYVYQEELSENGEMVFVRGQ
ncbi:MAG: peroxide stress protein YaaA [Candidatus Gracilibacteria bacterium]|nr:peroxide stress protein YaaA [Candidatus Gracilibacteria bacterium]